MRRAIALLLVSILPALCLAQTSANHQLPDDIKVLKATWQYGFVEPGNLRVGDPERHLEQNRAKGQLGPLDYETTLLRRPGNNNAAVVTIHNDGSKAIKAIRYDFIFVNTENGKEWLRYKFRNRVRVGTGETKTLTNFVVDGKSVAFRPPGVNPETGVNSEIRVVINRIKYADGSVWQRH